MRRAKPLLPLLELFGEHVAPRADGVEGEGKQNTEQERGKRKKQRAHVQTLVKMTRRWAFSRLLSPPLLLHMVKSPALPLK